MSISLNNFTVDESFFEPALRVARNYSRHRRDVLGLSDEQFLRLGIERVLGHCDSGRDFLQARQDRGKRSRAVPGSMRCTPSAGA